MIMGIVGVEVGYYLPLTLYELGKQKRAHGDI